MFSIWEPGGTNSIILMHFFVDKYMLEMLIYLYVHIVNCVLAGKDC